MLSVNIYNTSSITILATCQILKLALGGNFTFYSSSSSCVLFRYLLLLLDFCEMTLQKLPNHYNARHET